MDFEIERLHGHICCDGIGVRAKGVFGRSGAIIEIQTGNTLAHFERTRGYDGMEFRESILSFINLTFIPSKLTSFHVLGTRLIHFYVLLM